MSGDYEPKKTLQRNVKRVVVHKDFIARTFDNDLALLELESPVEFDEHIVPICMPQGQDSYVGTVGYVSGWGRLSYRKIFFIISFCVTLQLITFTISLCIR